MKEFKFDITRVPVLKLKHFEAQAEQLAAIGVDGYGATAEGQMNTWVDGVVRILANDGYVTVADLRKAAGMDVDVFDHFVGWDIRATTSIEIKENRVEFPLILIKSLGWPIDPSYIDWSKFDKVKHEGLELKNIEYFTKYIEDLKDFYKFTDEQFNNLLAGKRW
nr:MAG TPA: TETR FAMILY TRANSCRIPTIONAL REPRESSOR LFRR, LFRR, REPRESSOR, DNA-BINDING, TRANSCRIPTION [Caudoviricetes sp.]